MPECKGRYGAGNPGSARGVCRSCYGAALNAIKHGRLSWDELERLGLAQPVTYGNTNFHNAVAKARQKLNKTDK